MAALDEDYLRFLFLAGLSGKFSRVDPYRHVVIEGGVLRLPRPP
jgi:hypothetical protein